MNLLTAVKIKEEKELALENIIYLSKMKLAEMINIAFESGVADFIEKIETSVLQLNNDFI